MPKKLTSAQIAERVVYLLTVILVPSIPLFFLYSRNAAQGLLFRHFLITGGALAIISLVIYLLISKLLLRRRRAMIIVALFWAVFWFFHPLEKIIARGDVGFPQWKAVVYLLLLIIGLAFILRYISMSRLVANTIAVMFCLMFTFNFIPPALAVYAGEEQRLINERTGELPYEIKTEFNVDLDLPRPNVYWLHMDGMIGFDTVERYFNDPQTELKNELAERGFVINKDARLNAGYTRIAVPAMTSPTFYDSYLAGKFARVAQLTRGPRQNFFNESMTENGFSLEADIYPKTEIFKAFSDAGYLNIANYNFLSESENLDMFILIDGNNVNTSLDNYREVYNAFNTLADFKNLITDASAFSVVRSRIDEIFERKRPVTDTQQIPAYQETIDKYAAGHSGSGTVYGYPSPGVVYRYSGSDHMAYMVKGMKYAASMQTPHFIYFVNIITHTYIFGTVIGDVTYEKAVGRTFYLDEYGNYYKERLDDPLDVRLYLPQHKYAVKQMMAQIDVIIENDPDAVIIIQADHGIHSYGTTAFDSEAMSARGYSLEDQLNLSLDVLSAVRIPPQYGQLLQPLDPLDIARYLVNNFVGKGNYDYLHYTEESSR